jgi:hypothetical protein
MSRTYKHKYTSNLFKNGEHSHHNSLTREFKGVDGGGWLVKNSRGLIDRRDYESDRNKGIRHIINKKRRIYIKRQTTRLVEDDIQ